MRLKLEFSGGLELLFGGQKSLDVDAPLSDKGCIAELLPWMRDHLLKERPELFMKGDTVRPGILVLINESDWELCGMLQSELQEGDTLVFISTLHGGVANKHYNAATMPQTLLPLSWAFLCQSLLCGQLHCSDEHRAAVQLLH